jgi:hypothetical protein
VFIDREIFELQCYLPHGSGIALPSTAAGTTRNSASDSTTTSSSSSAAAAAAAAPALVIDCGANVGLFALWVAQRCPHAQVLAFEPSPSTYDYSAEGPLIVLDCL